MRRIHGIAVLAGLVASLVCCSATSQPGSFAEGGTTPADAAVVQTGSDSSLPANAVDAQATGPDARLGFGRDALADGSSSGLADATSMSVIEAGGSSAVDAGTPSAITSPWLVPMNQARAAVGDAPLQWDPIAAAVAQAYASQCDFQHNPNASAQYDARGGDRHRRREHRGRSSDRDDLRRRYRLDQRAGVVRPRLEQLRRLQGVRALHADRLVEHHRCRLRQGELHRELALRQRPVGLQRL